VTTDIETPEFDPDGTEVQFSIRAMLIATTVVAVAVTAVGVFIRTFPEDVRFNLAIYWGVLAVFFVALFAFHAGRRYLAEKQAGSIRFRLMRHSYFLPHAPVFVNYALGVLLLTAGPGMWVGGSFVIAEKHTVWEVIPNYSAMICVLVSGYGISYLWWRQVQLCEHGLIMRNDVTLWPNCQRWYWDACNKNVAVVVVDKGSPVPAKVPADDRAAVEALLN
jgi:hypothetical protein